MGEERALLKKDGVGRIKGAKSEKDRVVGKKKRIIKGKKEKTKEKLGKKLPPKEKGRRKFIEKRETGMQKKKYIRRRDKKRDE